MQTFIINQSFRKTAKILDNKRLGKQRVEAYQILKALSDSSYGWQNHPAVKMWRGYENALVYYCYCICEEWLRRGYKDTVALKSFRYFDFSKDIVKPMWLNNKFIKSHQSNLLRKDFKYYSRFFKNVPATLEYVWPVK